MKSRLPSLKQGLLIALILVVGAVGGVWVMGKYAYLQHLISDEQAFHSVILVINKNLQNGKLELPPEMAVRPAQAQAPQTQAPQAPTGKAPTTEPTP